MKLYTRTDLMELPDGVIYTKCAWGRSEVFQGLYVRRSVVGDKVDWCEQDLIANFHGYTLHAAHQALESGLGVQLGDAGGREGWFDDSIRYLVYENADLEYLQSVISDALKVSHEAV